MGLYETHNTFHKAGRPWNYDDSGKIAVRVGHCHEVVLAPEKTFKAILDIVFLLCQPLKSTGSG